MAYSISAVTRNDTYPGGLSGQMVVSGTPIDEYAVVIAIVWPISILTPPITPQIVYSVDGGANYIPPIPWGTPPYGQTITIGSPTILYDKNGTDTGLRATFSNGSPVTSPPFAVLLNWTFWTYEPSAPPPVDDSTDSATAEDAARDVYGVDYAFDAVGDLEVRAGDLTITSGARVVLQDVQRGIADVFRGSLWWSVDQGVGLVEKVESDFNVSQSMALRNEIQTEYSNHPQVDPIESDVTIEALSLETIKISCRVKLKETNDPFNIILIADTNTGLITAGR